MRPFFLSSVSTKSRSKGDREWKSMNRWTSFLWGFLSNPKWRKKWRQQEENRSKPKPSHQKNGCHTKLEESVLSLNFFFGNPHKIMNKETQYIYISFFSPWKLNSSLLRIYHPKRKPDRLPLPSFFKGELLNFRECSCFIHSGRNTEKHMILRSNQHTWKIPLTLHQQFLQESLSLWGFGEVVGYLPRGPCGQNHWMMFPKKNPGTFQEFESFAGRWKMDGGPYPP